MNLNFYKGTIIMKKDISVLNEESNIDELITNQHVRPQIPEYQKNQSPKLFYLFNVHKNFYTIISLTFLALLLVGIVFKFIFPTIDSIRADIEYKKMSKSVVYDFMGLIKETNYKGALNLTDFKQSNPKTEALTQMIHSQIGSNNIVNTKIVDVLSNKKVSSWINDQNFTVVKTLITFKIGETVQSKVQSFLVKSTPKGLKISLDGLIKSYNLIPNTVTIDKKYCMTLNQLDYCVDGINLRIRISNQTYEKLPMKGKLTLETTEDKYITNIDLQLSPKVNYQHNILFSQAVGEPEKLIIEMGGSKPMEIPIEVR
jgi:hypothetical protein